MDAKKKQIIDVWYWEVTMGTKWKSALASREVGGSTNP